MLYQQAVVALDQGCSLFTESLHIRHLTGPEADPGGFVGVDGTDAPTGCADGLLAPRSLPCSIQGLMGGENDVGRSGEFHPPRPHVYPQCGQFVQFLCQLGPG